MGGRLQAGGTHPALEAAQVPLQLGTQRLQRHLRGIGISEGWVLGVQAHLKTRRRVFDRNSQNGKEELGT